MKNKPIRGFKELIGQTIKKIDSSSVNLLKIETETGEIFEIDCDDQVACIGIIQCKKVKDSSDFWSKNYGKYKE